MRAREAIGAWSMVVAIAVGALVPCAAEAQAEGTGTDLFGGTPGAEPEFGVGAEDLDEAPGAEASPAVAQEAPEPEGGALREFDDDPRASFFARMSLGLGYGAVNASDKSALPPLDDTFHGWSLAPSFAVGTRTREDLFLHASAWLGGVTDGNAQVHRPGMRMAGAGLGFTYYFLPARVFITATPGISITFFRRPSGNYDKAALGFAAQLGVGRDFVLNNGWSLGCSLEGRVTRTRADTEIYLGGEGLVAFTVTYGAPE